MIEGRTKRGLITRGVALIAGAINRFVSDFGSPRNAPRGSVKDISFNFQDFFRDQYFAPAAACR
jgi:hypothetical protein